MVPQSLVILPGLDGTEILCAPLQNALPAWVPSEVVVYPSAGANGYDDLLPLVLAAIDRLPRCLVLGWSFSGPLALRAAMARPDRVRGVVLASTFVRPPLRWLPWVRPMLCTPVVGTVRVLRRLPIWLGRPASDPLRRAKAAIWQRVPARVLAARSRAIARVDARDALRGCAVPVLALAAAADRVVPPHNTAELLRERPDLRVASLPGRHFSLYTHPADAAAAIAAFARELAD